MPKLSKLQKFAAIKTFPNVYSSKSHDSHLLIDHQGSQLDMKGKWKQHFGNNNPITLEVACGKGHYARGLGKIYPDRNFIGVELKGNRIWTGAKAALDEAQDNVAFLRARIEFLENYFAPAEVDEIWITFPDPQLGKARKRTTSPRFLNVYKNILKQENKVHLKTDSPELYAYTHEVLQEMNIEIVYDNDDIYAQAFDFPELAIKTYYELMHLENNKSIKYIQFKL